MKKTVLSLISYDADLLPKSIEKYYDYVDEILLGLDSSRISWSGNNFTFDEAALFTALKALDTKNKISVIEENFHKSKIAIDNDNYERNYLKSYASNDMIISIDADEYLLNAKQFFNKYLPVAERYLKQADICFTWLTPYKRIDDKILVIANNDNTPFVGETQGFITDKNSTFTYARWTDKSASGQNRLTSPLGVAHWSLCRSKEQLLTKISNTGHSDIKNKDPFFDIWSRVDMSNYHELSNFKTSGLGGAQWPKLVPVLEHELAPYLSSALQGIY